MLCCLLIFFVFTQQICVTINNISNISDYNTVSELCVCVGLGKSYSMMGTVAVCFRAVCVSFCAILLVLADHFV